ncbi:hypothetical protein MRX96_029998 [Rhipicephalus microplus]
MTREGLEERRTVEATREPCAGGTGLLQSEVVGEPETETESRVEGDPLEDCEGEGRVGNHQGCRTVQGAGVRMR